MVRLVYIIIISHISVLSCYILLRPAMVHQIYIIVTFHISVLMHNLLIFTMLRPTCISTHKASNKQALPNLLYISSLFLITTINTWATYVEEISHVFWLLVFCSSLQKSFQSLDKTLAHSITSGVVALRGHRQLHRSF
jgi:hypothetical protein